MVERAARLDQNNMGKIAREVLIHYCGSRKSYGENRLS